MRCKYTIFLFFFLTTLQASDKVDISTLIFFDLTYEKISGSSFNVNRTYLNVKKSIGDNMSIRVTNDVGRRSYDNRLVLFLKYAFITLNTHYGDLLVGVQPTNYFGPTKATWGYRFIEKYPTDLAGLGATSDLGISLKKEVRPELWIHGAIYNGTGYKKAENDNYKRMTLLISYGEQKLNKSSGWNMGGAASIEPYRDKPYLRITTTIFAGFANASVRLGIENTIQKTNEDNDQLILTAFYCNYKTSPSTSLLLRTDRLNPSSQMKGDSKSYVIIGASFVPNPGFIVAPNIRYTVFENLTADPNPALMINFQFKF